MNASRKPAFYAGELLSASRFILVFGNNIGIKNVCIATSRNEKLARIQRQKREERDGRDAGYFSFFLCFYGIASACAIDMFRFFYHQNASILKIGSPNQTKCFALSTSFNLIARSHRRSDVDKLSLFTSEVFV